MRINIELNLTEGEIKRLLGILHGEALWRFGQKSDASSRQAWRLLDKIQVAAGRWLDFGERGMFLRRRSGGELARLDADSRKAVGA